MDTNTQVAPVEAPPAAKAKKPIYKRWWAIALAGIFAIVVISAGDGRRRHRHAGRRQARRECAGREGPAQG